MFAVVLFTEKIAAKPKVFREVRSKELLRSGSEISPMQRLRLLLH